MAGVRVNECRVLATGAGAAWWMAYRSRAERVGRVSVVTATLGGDVVEVCCDSTEDARWLADHAQAQGVPAAALRVLR